MPDVELAASPAPGRTPAPAAASGCERRATAQAEVLVGSGAQGQETGVGRAGPGGLQEGEGWGAEDKGVGAPWRRCGPPTGWLGRQKPGQPRDQTLEGGLPWPLSAVLFPGGERFAAAVAYKYTLSGKIQKASCNTVEFSTITLLTNSNETS